LVDLDTLTGFIADMPGDSAEVTKTNLVAMEREIREGRAAKAILAANGIVGDVCAAIAGRKPVFLGLDLARSE
jgi:hypothetical protein